MLKALLLTCVIDAMEGHNAARVEIPGAFMHTDIDELIHMKLRREMAELMVKPKTLLEVCSE